jgi:hypothetical protein
MLCAVFNNICQHPVMFAEAAAAAAHAKHWAADASGSSVRKCQAASLYLP